MGKQLASPRPNAKPTKAKGKAKAAKPPKAEKPTRAQRKAAKGESDVHKTFRLLRQFTRNERRHLYLAIVMLIVEAVSAVKVPLLLGPYLVDSYLTQRLQGQQPASPLSAISLPFIPPIDLHALGLPMIVSTDVEVVAVVALVFILLTIFNSMADSMAEIYFAQVGRNLGYEMRVALYSHLEKLSLAFYSRQRTGDILQRVTSDVTEIEDFVFESVSDILGSILLIVVILYEIIRRVPQVGIVAVALIPIMAVISNYYSKRIKAASKKQKRSEGELASVAQEMLGAIRVIQTYGQGRNFQRRFAKQNKDTTDVALEAAVLEARFSWVVSVLEALVLATVVGLMAYLILGPNAGLVGFGVGLLAAFIKLIEDMFKPTKKIIKEYNTFAKMFACAERIAELLDRKPDVEDMPGAVPSPQLRGHVAFEHVSFAYFAEDTKTARLALRDVSFTVRPGEVVALVGGSGAGKSTIVQLLPRLYDPHMGKVTIDGHDIRAFTLASLRGQMSMVLQESILFTGTVAENIAYGREDAPPEEIIAAAIQANAHEFIEKLPDGYQTVLSERASNLSGGQRQRIAIARAFIRNTSILILDEPTTGLDAESTDLVLTALRTLMAGKSTLIISHDLNLIRHADNILVVKEGQIAESGTHKQLLNTGGLYAFLYHKQFGGDTDGQLAIEVTTGSVVAEEPDEDEEPISPKVFQTLMTQALPKAISQDDFNTMMLPVMRGETEFGPPLDDDLEPAHAGAAAAPAASAAPAAAPAPPAAAPAAPAQAPPRPRVQLPGPGPGQEIYSTAVIPLLRPPPPPGGGEPPEPVEPAEPAAAAEPEGEPESSPNGSSLLDPLNSPRLHDELPSLRAALDGTLMREALEDALFGDAGGTYQITRCEPGKTLYLGDRCLLRYELEVADHGTGRTLHPLVNARIFRDEGVAATYLRDRLAPLATLMRGREEIAPFTRPVAAIVSLGMVVSVFPIDGELPALVGATNRWRMAEVLGEALPDVLQDDFTVSDCTIELVQYRRQHRCVLRYEVFGAANGAAAERRVIYGKVADSGGELVGPIVSMLREQLLDGDRAYRFKLPRPVGFRPDLHLALLEEIPGAPRLTALFKARVAGVPDPEAGGLTLEAAIDACAHVAGTLHLSGIELGHRRSFDHDLNDLRRGVASVLAISPDLGNQLDDWLGRLENAAEQSDTLPFVLSHGDYTHTQLVFDGTDAGLVDFDTICRAEPALDLGQFLAYLRVADAKANRAAGDDGASSVGDELATRFLDTYLGAIGSQVPEDTRELLQLRVPVYEVGSLMRMALHSWQQLKGAKLENVLGVLARQVECLR